MPCLYQLPRKVGKQLRRFVVLSDARHSERIHRLDVRMFLASQTLTCCVSNGTNSQDACDSFHLLRRLKMYIQAKIVRLEQHWLLL